MANPTQYMSAMHGFVLTGSLVPDLVYEGGPV